MNGSILVFGSNKENRKKVCAEIVNKEIEKDFSFEDLRKKPDLMIIQKEEGSSSIGIEESRSAIKFLCEKPLELKRKFLIILDAETMTNQAQNSLLKTLEEPPDYALIILSSKSQNYLLDTVVSRCRIIQLSTERQIDYDSQKNLDKILKMDLGHRLDWANEISKDEKEDIIQLLQDWVEEERCNMIKNPTVKEKATNVKLIMKVKEDLEKTNVNPRLALETLILSLY